MLQRLSDNQHFPDIVAGEEELQRSVVMEKIFDVAIIEDALQPELGTVLQTQSVDALDVIAVVRSVWSGIFRMEEREQIAFGIQHRRDALDHRLHQRLGKIVGNVPAEDGIELHVAEDEVFFEETIDVDSARLGAAAVFGILRKKQNVFVIDAMSELGEMRDVRRRCWSKIQDSETFGAFKQARELS